jgi:hypothetical protein
MFNPLGPRIGSSAPNDRRNEMRRFVAVAAMTMCIAWCLLGAGRAQAAPPPERTFGDTVGLNVKFSQGEPQGGLPLLKELGVRWVRDNNVGWREVEPEPGKYAEFAQGYRERLKFYKENGIGVCYFLGYENSKAYPDTPEKPFNSIDPEAFGRYAVEAAKLLKASGVRFVLEIWNEPHNFTLQKKVGGEWNAKPPSPWVDHYVKMVHEAVRQVKAYDPQVRLIDDDDMWIIHYWFLEKGLPKALDGFAFHPYAGASDGPEMCAVGQETGWAKPFTMTDADRSLHSAVRRLREQAVAKMGKVPALWVTEWGWKLGDKSPFTLMTPDGKMTEESIAAYVPRAFITSAAAGVEAVLWFSSYDSVDGAMGLRGNDGKQRKAFGAFKTMTQELGAATLVRQVIGGDHRTSGVQAYLFRAPAGEKLVLWDIDGTDSFVVNGKGIQRDAVRITDVQGQSVPLQVAKDGRILLSLSQAPIYVTGLPADLSLEAAPPDVATAPVYLFP